MDGGRGLRKWAGVNDKARAPEGRGADVVGGACAGRDAGESAGARGCGDAGESWRERSRCSECAGPREARGPREWNVITADRNDPLLGLTGGMLGRVGRKEPAVRRSPARAHCLSWRVLPRP